MPKFTNLFSCSLFGDDSVTLESDLGKLDVGALDKRDFSAAVLSYADAFVEGCRRLPRRTLYLASTVMVVFLSALLAASENGDENMDLMNSLYRSFRGGESGSGVDDVIKTGDRL